MIKSTILAHRLHTLPTPIDFLTLGVTNYHTFLKRKLNFYITVKENHKLTKHLLVPRHCANDKRHLTEFMTSRPTNNNYYKYKHNIEDQYWQ